MSSLLDSLPPAKRPATDKRHRPCRTCGRFGSCLIGEAAYCVPCAPPSFWPKNRGGRG